MSHLGFSATGNGIPSLIFSGQTSGHARTRHIAHGIAAAGGLQVAFPNLYLAPNETSTGGTATVSATVEYGGVAYRLQWSASNSVTIPDGAISPASDFLSLPIPDGTAFYIRSDYANSASKVLSVFYIATGGGQAASDSANGEQWVIGGADQSGNTGDLTGTSQVIWIYRPIAIVSSLPDTQHSFLLIGDSRDDGVNDAYTGTSGNRGQLARAIGTTFGYCNVGRYGETLSDFITSHTVRAALQTWADVVICEHGINDVVGGPPAGTIIANMSTVAGYFSGKLVYQSTLGPVTTGTWDTAAHQTVTAFESIRTSVNGSIRGGLSGFTGYLEIADILETARDSGKWTGSGAPAWDASHVFTVDGVHEQNIANIAIQAAALPGAPTIGTATATSSTAATVAFTAGSAGIAPTTLYTATSSPGGLTGTSATSPITVSGLTKNTAYTFTVTATNLLGTGVASSASNSVTPSDILFTGAANSGDIAAASSFSGSASWSGTNRALSVDVSMLGPGVTVSAMTYGGAACTKVGSKSTVTSFGSVECWRICSSDSGAPAAGANTLAVTLSGSLEFTVAWASYSGVNQSLPTEGFNSAQATNVGAADATVSITSTADNCWIHGAVVASDTSITANQTSRNNVSGTLGTGANEDNGAAKTPAGAVTISYTGVGAAVTWAIAGYALVPSSDTAPGAPTIGTATATGNTTATVAFTAPASNGGSVITSYVATPSSGAGTGTLSQAGSGTITVTGLTAGTSYTFTVHAVNELGNSAESAASNSITTQSNTNIGATGMSGMNRAIGRAMRGKRGR